MTYRHTIGGQAYAFPDLKMLLAKATPARSGDALAGLAAGSAQERVAAQMALADTRLTEFLSHAVVPYESDEVTRLIVDTHDPIAFAPLAHLTVGGFRDWLLSDAAHSEALTQVAPGITPEMAAAVTKIMRVQDLITVGAKRRVVTRFRNTIGLPGRLSTRIQPNHPTDDPRGVAASLLDGLLLGGGDAVLGINPATDNVDICINLLKMLDEMRLRFDIPVQSCVLTHVTNTIQAIERGAPVDLVFQSIAGTQAANDGFGVNLALLREGREAALSLRRGTIGDNVMYFETGQGSALSAGAHHGVDQQTLECRAYAVARAFSPLLVNTVVGFIGPEYLFNGKQIIRAGLEDHCAGKLLGLPMGCDVCYTNHAEADQDDMDVLLTLIAAAGGAFIMGVPGADDIMLNYQSTSHHDALYVRRLLGKRPAPEFEAWLERMEIFDAQGNHHQLAARSTSPMLEALGELASAHGNLEPASVWTRLREFTPARIGVAPTGVSQPTREHLEFQWDHAQARDAVGSLLDLAALQTQLGELGLETLSLHSEAADRSEYIQRPNLGRRLNLTSLDTLSQEETGYDVIFAIADGLSATAANRHAAPLLAAVLPALRQSHWKIGPVALVEQGRVAVGDPIAEALGADMVIVLIGERPGLTTPDSLGVYLTWRPCGAVADSQRNCLSNVRPEGLPYSIAAARLLYLMREARARQISGIALKDESDPSLLMSREEALLPEPPTL